MSLVLYKYYFLEPLTFTPLSSKLKKTKATTQDSEKVSKAHVRILVINGGGINGLMPLIFLKSIEKMSKKPVTELFDYYVGTSTGAIISAALNVPGNEKGREFSPQRLINTYKKLAKRILQPSMFRRVLTLDGFSAPKIAIESLYDALTETIGGEVRFKDLINRVSISAFNLNEFKLVFFNNWQNNSGFANFSVDALLTAACATPSIYSPVILKTKDGKESFYMDAVFSANNPVLFAVHNALEQFKDIETLTIVHLGTGGLMKNMKVIQDGFFRWGMARWLPPLLTISYSAQSVKINEALININRLKTRISYKYFYLNENFDGGGPFDFSEENIMLIEKTSENYVLKNQVKFDQIIKRVTGSDN